MEILTGRIIYEGKASASVLVSTDPIGFFGHVDTDTGRIKEPTHPLFGKNITNKILVFPSAKGSTVGSYILYALKKKKTAPAGMIMGHCELIVAVGAIISKIPTIDNVDITKFKDGNVVTIEGEKILIENAHIF